MASRASTRYHPYVIETRPKPGRGGVAFVARIGGSNMPAGFACRSYAVTGRTGARSNAHVVEACRNPGRGAVATVT